MKRVRALAGVLTAQENVLTRRQFLALGFTADQLRTRLREEWQVAHRGVYVVHRGALTRRERDRAAALATRAP